MGEMQRLTISDIGELYDGPHATPKRRDDGPYFLNISSLKSGRLDLAASDHVSEEDYTRWTRRVTPQGGDLLFSYETRIGEAALMPDGVRACLGRRMALLRPDQSVVVPRFLVYYYLGPGFQRVIESHAIHGATVNRIGLATMPKWEISIPGLSEQQAIAEVLGALDDKIVANDDIVRIMDQLADATVISRFDGRTETLKSVALITMGLSPPGVSYNEYSEGVPFYQGVRDFGVRFPTRRVWTKDPARMAEVNDTLVSVRAPVGETNIANEAMCIGRGIASLQSVRKRPMTLFRQVRAAKNEWAPYQSEGTVFGSINKKQLESIEIPSIDEKAAEYLERDLVDLETRIGAALSENANLSTTRDELLPLLLSGKVRVRDAEKVVEEVV